MSRELTGVVLLSTIRTYIQAAHGLSISLAKNEKRRTQRAHFAYETSWTKIIYLLFIR